MESFRLTKWYIDAVDAGGRAGIAYWTRLDWGPVSVGWEEVSIFGESGRTVHRSAWSRSIPPARSGESIRWQSDRLGCHVTCEPWCSSFDARLLDSREGAVDWNCAAPGADVTLDAGDGCVVRGDGYAEQLVVTRLPWRLPISELRWGRWMSSRRNRSIVWIDWRGPHPLTVVLDGGVPCGHPSVGDGVVSFAAQEGEPGTGVLRIERSETLHVRVLSDIVQGLGPLARRLPASWLKLEDRKTLSHGTFLCSAELPETGWALHELVRFP